jgi:hypothetical protein
MPVVLPLIGVRPLVSAFSAQPELFTVNAAQPSKSWHREQQDAGSNAPA